MDAARKSVGLIIDDLITTSMKLWHAQEMERDVNVTDEELGKQFRKIQALNVRRNADINALDELLDRATFSTSEKTYVK